MKRIMLAAAFVAGFLAVSMSALCLAEEIPAGAVCSFSGQITPFNQGLLNYTVWSDASSQTTENKVAMGRRMSIVDYYLASQYLVLDRIGENELVDVQFSMLEHYACMIPAWLYARLEGVYLAKYQAGNVARASVIVFEDRETAVLVAQILMMLATDDLETRIVNGNFVYYTTQNSYWWSYDNMLVRVSAHTPPTKADRYGNIEDLPPVQVCETVDVLGGMQDGCLEYQFWQEVPEDLLLTYLAKLPSDAEEIPWPRGGILRNARAWPTKDQWEIAQMGCGGGDVWGQVGNPWEEEGKLASRPNDRVKITSVGTDKRWYYLGEMVTILATGVSTNGYFGNVIADVKDDIYPHPEFTSVPMQPVECGPRVPYVERITGIDPGGIRNRKYTVR